MLFPIKLIVAGGRDYHMESKDFDRLDDIPNVIEVVSGCARGVDSAGECWARHRMIPVKQFPADWNTHGKAAGPLRNLAMAQYADAVALFPGGRGTDNMFKTAKNLGLTIFDFRKQ